jgi:two-component system nitrogen regulation response regulator GlnG
MTEERLLISTLLTGGGIRSRSKIRVPCVTVACHPDPRRIGERALLTPLLVRQAVELSRIETMFAQPSGGSSRPLADPYLSRDPVRLVHGPERGSVVLDGLPARAQLDGRPVAAAQVLSAAMLEHGVLVQLSSRVLLLLHASAAEAPQPVEGILGDSDAIDEVRRTLVRLAELDTSILIRGESGVGKERVAQALHASSKRRAHAFVAVNMATLSESTAASALFGHARGAFTGAVARHRGFFERADGGTLFLDEVGDTPQAVQPMLLRALETGRIQPLGQDDDRAVDVRVLAATDADLEGDVRETRPHAGTAFRQALKHRLAGYEISVPPLRERVDDVPRLFVHFLRAELEQLGRAQLLDGGDDVTEPPLRSQLMARLMRRPFPGNVRELFNLARRVAIDAAASGVIELGDEAASPAPEAVTAAASEPPPGPSIDETALLEALERHAFSPQRVASELGVPPSTVHFWMRRAGIRRGADLGPEELEQARAECDGDVTAMARKLRVSERAIRLALRRRP